MRPIKELTQDVSSRIAAGEVIENPASVVKELMENSIDANSLRIDVRLGNGGKSTISVEDDGTGIPFEELPLSIKRFATSKIVDVEDLSRIDSLGYRGEALASICAVSRIEIRSYRPGSENGGMLRASGGEIQLHVPLQAQAGTRIQVEDLFYNLPARRNFLKSASAESRKVTALIRDYSAAFPEVSFSVLVDGKNIYSSDGGKSRAAVLKKIWGSSDDIRQSNFSDRGVFVEAAWLPSSGSRRKDLTVFMNRRRVRESTVAAAASSCGDAAAGIWMFFITVPTELLDVNIHPGKAEVRVHSSLPLFENVRRAIAILVENSHIGPLSFGFQPGPVVIKDPGRAGTVSNHFMEKDPVDLFSRVCEPSTEYVRHINSSSADQNASFIGQTSSGYLLFNGKEELIILDPHAAHERILFERLLQREGDSNAQNLSFPEQIPPTLSERICEFRKSLEEAGFSFEERSGSLFLSAVPAGSGPGYMSDPVEVLRAWLKALDGLEKTWTTEGKLPERACKEAVKLGERISREEASRLFEDLGACRTPSMCPHGRPTLIRLRSEDLDRLFGRR